MLDKKSSDQLVARLKVKYPDWDSFEHPQFVEDEIKYKQATAKKASELLSKEGLTSLLRDNAYEEIVRRIDEVGKDNNLLFRGVPRNSDLNILYEENLDKKLFAEAFVDLLYGEGSSVERLGRYIEFLEDHELQSKWTFPTYFLFFTHPNEEFFVKPRITTRLLRELQLDIGVGQPSAEKYATIRQFAHDLFDGVKEWGPRDMIDIQSLFWVAGQNKLPDDTTDPPLSMAKKEEFRILFKSFYAEYVKSDTGRLHAERYNQAVKTGRENFREVLAARERVEDIVRLVLDKLIPHSPGGSAAAEDKWVHNAPIAATDLKALLEGKGTADDDSWPDIAGAIVDFFERCNKEPDALADACEEFKKSSYSKGFASGTLSPMLNSLQPDEFTIINSKPVQVLHYLTGKKLKTSIREYPAANTALLDFAEAVEDVLKDVDLPDIHVNHTIDMFCHWLVAEANFHFGKLAEPFSKIFVDRFEAEQAFDLLHESLLNLGAVVDDQRIALTLPKGKNLLRLNFGQWLVMDFRPDSSGNNLCQVALLDKLAREAGLETESTPFADSKDAETATAYMMPTSRILEDENLQSIVKESMAYTGRLFEKWAGTPYRFAHRQDILEAVFDENKRDTLLSGGASEIRYWKIAPGEGARIWEECLQQGIIALAWAELGDLSGITKEEFDDRLRACLKKNSDWGRGGAEQPWTLAHEIQVGDKIVANRGTTEVIGIGTVTGSYYFREGTEHGHTVPVNWEDTNVRTVDEYGWRRTIVKLTEEKYNEIAEKAIADWQEGEFSPRTFDLLAGLHKKPTKAFYGENKAEIQRWVETPVQSLLREVVTQLPKSITDVVETEKRLFGLIVKNDWGRGGAWDYYWGALYPKGTKKTDDAQLFVWINKDCLEIGFSVGSYGGEAKKRLAENLTNYRDQIAEFLATSWGEIGFKYGKRDLDGGPIESFEDWLGNPEAIGYRALVALDKQQVLSRQRQELVGLAAEVFKAVFPLVLLSGKDDPLKKVAAYLGAEPLPRQARFTIEDCMKATSFASDQLSRWLRAIERKKQAVFYGPPGTGKTFVAELLAKVVVSETDGFVELVQFHPAYSYEEFMQGIRPRSRADGGLEYPLVAGRFLEFCRRASSRDGSCVLIIDEINRANLSRVFGELMYLMEYRDKDVKLAAGDPFRIPDNVRIIGTMNTADRSIALVDHALRRRFAFIPLHPEYDVLTKYHEKEKSFDPTGLIKVLRKVNSEIGDSNYEIGISFFLTKEIEKDLPDIWSMEIEPYLEEYFFDQPAKVGELRWESVRDQVLPS